MRAPLLSSSHADNDRKLTFEQVEDLTSFIN